VNNFDPDDAKEEALTQYSTSFSLNQANTLNYALIGISEVVVTGLQLLVNALRAAP
jgi:hypothetical protein